MITLDFETYYDKAFSLRKMTTESYVRDPRFEVIGVGIKINDAPAYWITENIQEHLDSLELENEKVLAHNMVFDGFILSDRYGIHPKFLLDTLSMARPLNGITAGGSLAKLAEYFQLGVKGNEVVQAMGKRKADFTTHALEQYGAYCRNDCELTYWLLQKLMGYSTKQELYIIDMMLRMFTDPVIEVNGDLLEEHLIREQARKAKLLKKVSEFCGSDELMSNPKFAVVLEKLGVEPPMKVSPTTGKETYAFAKTDPQMKALLEHDDPKVQAVVGARLGTKSTLEETRTESLIGVSERGPLPILLNYYGAHTGRASGGDKMNLQNLPRGGKLRESLAAPEGHKMIAVDSSQIEARIVAWLADEKELVDDFANGVDIYSKFAGVVYNKEVNKKDHPTERFLGKTCILGLGYGLGHVKLRAQLKQGGLDMPEDEVKRAVDLYRMKYRNIKKLWTNAQIAIDRMAMRQHGLIGTHKFELNVDAHKGIELPNGMWVRYPELQYDKLNDEITYKSKFGRTKLYGGKVVENVVQALARIVVFNQMAKIDQMLRKRDGQGGRHKVVLTVHDEVVAVVPDSYAEQTLAEMLEIMSQAPKWAEGLPVACEGNIGSNYCECK